MMEYANMHFALESVRDDSQSSGKDGPRVLLLGPDNAGKTTLAKILTAYATKVGGQPLVVNLDPTEGMLSVPGTLSATAFRTMLDVENGWGSSPMSGPSPVPVKLPLVYSYPLPSPLDGEGLVYRPIVSRLALQVTERMAKDEDVRKTGIIVDTPGALSSGTPLSLELINHIVTEFAITNIVVLGSERLYSNMVKQYDNKPSASAAADIFDERVSVVKLSKSGGCVDRDALFLKKTREAQIRSYFFGNSAQSPASAITLSPSTLQIDFSSLTVYNYTVISQEDEDEDDYDPSNLNTGDSFLPGGGVDDYSQPKTESDRAAPLPGIIGLSSDQNTNHTNTTSSSNVPLKRVLPPAPAALENTLIAITHASTTAALADVRDASIKGFLYVASVDADKGKIMLLSPIRGTIPAQAMIWARRWPDEVVGMVG